jgi:hypothetical protein
LILVKEIVLHCAILDTSVVRLQRWLGTLANARHHYHNRCRVKADLRFTSHLFGCMRLKLISCDIFEREVLAAAARSLNHIEITFLNKPPHQISDSEALESIQAIIDHSNRSSFHAVLLIAGSCKKRLTGIQARSIPLVLPRAKDCISLLLEREPTHGRPAGSRPKQTAKSASCQNRLISGASLRAMMAHPCRLPELARNEIAVPRFSLNATLDLREQSVRRWAARKARGTRRQLSPLDMLVDGFWNYPDFLVVPPGWILTEQDEGTLTAQELSP